MLLIARGLQQQEDGSDVFSGRRLPMICDRMPK
jgi:hypothetical protein